VKGNDKRLSTARQIRYQPQMLATPGQHFLHSLFLADELDLDAGLSRQPIGVLAQLVAERLGETRVVEDPQLALVKKEVIPAAKKIFGSVPKTNTRSQQCSTPAILRRMSLCKKFDAHAPA
jgi:hypothetical protein